MTTRYLFPLSFVFGLAAAAAAPTLAQAQQLELPRPSATAKVSQMVGLTEVAVDVRKHGLRGA